MCSVNTISYSKQYIGTLHNVCMDYCAYPKPCDVPFYCEAHVYKHTQHIPGYTYNTTDLRPTYCGNLAIVYLLTELFATPQAKFSATIYVTATKRHNFHIKPFSTKRGLILSASTNRSVRVMPSDVHESLGVALWQNKKQGIESPQVQKKYKTWSWATIKS